MQTRPPAANAPREGNTRFKRSAWFAGLWFAGVISLAVVVYVIRWAIRP